MTEDFAVLDFAVVPATPAAVAHALGQAWPQAACPPDAVAGQAQGPRPGGLLGRLMSRRDAVARSAPVPPLLLQSASAISGAPHARTGLSGPALADSALRLSAPDAPHASGPVTLIELLEDLNGEARLCRALSAALPGTEVFFFRYSGSLHPGAHFAFHVYRDGRAQRRAVSRSMSGDHPEAPWQATDSGMPHRVEADSLPPPEAPAADIMTPERQGAILSALGLEADSLFADLSGRNDVLVLSTAPGGAPLSELASEGTGAGLRRPPALSPDPVARQNDTSDGADRGETAADVAMDAALTAQAQPSLGEIAAPISPSLGLPAEAHIPPPIEADDPAPDATAQDPTPDVPPLTPQPPDAPVPADPEAWEREVTNLLLACVEAGLPEDARVPWLQDFTARLESGDVEGALRSAASLIDGTEPPAADRQAALQRLSRLYAHLQPDPDA